MSTAVITNRTAGGWVRGLAYAWAFFPGTAIGLSVALVGLFFASRYAVRRGVLEVHGGAANWFLRVGIPGIGEMPAMTLGHVVLGRDQAMLDLWRDHEHVHVRQFELWGPLMIPVLYLSGIQQSAAGKDPYYDNYFEREAYGTVNEPNEVTWRPRRTKLQTSPAVLVRRAEA